MPKSEGRRKSEIRRPKKARHSDLKRVVKSSKDIIEMKKLFLLSIFTALLAGCASWHEQQFTFVQMCDPQLGMGGYEADVARFTQSVNQINALKPDFVV